MKENIQLASKHKKNFPTLVIKDWKLITRRYYYTSTKVRKSDNIKGWGDCRASGIIIRNFYGNINGTVTLKRV